MTAETAENVGGFDFEKGGVDSGVFYPPLKPVQRSIVFTSKNHGATYYCYEPGNMTRYNVIFSEFNTQYDGRLIVMSLFDGMNGTMVIPFSKYGVHDIGYMMEKLQFGAGDCYALIPLINHHLEQV